MSTFGSLRWARERWKDLEVLATERGQPVRVGYFIAELVLRPGFGFALEDLGEVDEHLTLWGDPDCLVAAVANIYQASTPEE